MCTISALCLREFRVRNMAITGVMPLPAVTNRILAGGGGGAGSPHSPFGEARRTMVPGCTPFTRCVDRKPSGVAFTVIVMFLLSRRGIDVNEYERQCHRPSIRNPMPTYCPGRYLPENPQPGFIVTVAESAVSECTSTMRPRSSGADHSGLSILR